MNFIKTNLWEIDRSPLMKYLGALLSALHLVNFFYWLKLSPFLASGSKPLLCWDFLPQCGSLTVSNPALISWLFTIYGVISGIAFLFFITQRFVGMAWTSLFIGQVLFILFYTLDASLMSDALCLLLFLSLSFLLVPNKTPIFRWSILIYYLAIAYLELTPEWLSGAVLYSHFPVSYKALEWVSGLGVLIKVTLPFLLLSPIGQRLALGVTGLVVFHIFQFYILHDFASIALISLNLFYVFNYFVSRRLEREALYQSYAHPEPSKLWCALAIFSFLFFQTPFVTPDSFAEMFKLQGPPKSYDCSQISFARYKKEIVQFDNLISTDLPSQVRCHPLVAFQSAKEKCRELKKSDDFQSMSSFLLVKGWTEAKFAQSFSHINICDDSVQSPVKGGG